MFKSFKIVKFGTFHWSSTSFKTWRRARGTGLLLPFFFCSIYSLIFFVSLHCRIFMTWNFRNVRCFICIPSQAKSCVFFIALLFLRSHFAEVENCTKSAFFCREKIDLMGFQRMHYEAFMYAKKIYTLQIPFFMALSKGELYKLWNKYYSRCSI